MKLFSLLGAAVLAAGLTVGTADAASVDFEVGAGTTASATSSCVGVCSASATLAPGVIGTMFSLEEGETERLDFFDLTVKGIGVGSYSVEYTLEMDPGGLISDTGSGGFFSFFGIVSGGTLMWNNAVQTVAFGNGGLYTIAVRDGVAVGLGNTATIWADVTLDAAPVPLPASALLLLAAVGGLGAVRMRKQAA